MAARGEVRAGEAGAVHGRILLTAHGTPVPACLLPNPPPTHRRNSLASTAQGSGCRSRVPMRGARMLLRFTRRSTPAQPAAAATVGSWPADISCALHMQGRSHATFAMCHAAAAQPPSVLPPCTASCPALQLTGRLVLDDDAVAAHNLRHGASKLVAAEGRRNREGVSEARHGRLAQACQLELISLRRLRRESGCERLVRPSCII